MTATVGGTLVSRICGLSPWGGPLSAYFELTEDVQAPRTPAMGRGNALEASVLALYAERERRIVMKPPNGQFRPPSMPYAHATLDALSHEEPRTDADTAWPWTVVDAKTANAYAMGAWGRDGSDRIPEEYHCQLLWYGGVMRAAGFAVTDESHLPVLSGPESELQWAARLVQATGRPLCLADLEGTGLDFRVCVVQWDEALFRALDERVRRFLAEHVVPRIPPMPGPGDVVLDRDAHAVAKGLRARKGEWVDFERLSPADQAVLMSVVDASRQRKQWESLEDEARARAQLVMGGAEEVRGFPGGARVTWRARQSGVRVFKVEEPRT